MKSSEIKRMVKQEFSKCVGDVKPIVQFRREAKKLKRRTFHLIDADERVNLKLSADINSYGNKRQIEC